MRLGFFKLFLSFAVLAFSQVWAQSYLKDIAEDGRIKISEEELKRRIEILNQYSEWEKRLNLDPKSQAVRKGFYMLETTPGTNILKKKEFLFRVLKEIDHTHKPKHKGTKIYLEDYLRWYQDLKLLKDSTSSKNPQELVGFRMASPELDYKVRELETAIAYLRDHEESRLRSVDKKKYTLPMRWSKPSTKPLSNNDAKLEGLSGASAWYAIQVEREALLERIQDLKSLQNNAGLRADSKKIIDSAIKEAQKDLESFEQEIKDFSRLSNKQSNPLSISMGSSFDSPNPLPPFKYWPHPNRPSGYNLETIREAGETSKQERSLAVDNIKNKIKELRMMRAQTIDAYLPGYSELEVRHNELQSEISNLGSQIIERKQFGPINIVDRKRIYPIRNQELNYWEQISALDDLIANRTLDKSQLKHLQDIIPSFINREDYSSSEIDSFKELRNKVINLLIEEVKSNTLQIESERQTLISDFHNNIDQMNRVRLGLDSTMIEKKIAELKSKKESILKPSDEQQKQLANELYNEKNPLTHEQLEERVKEIIDVGAIAAAEAKKIDLQIAELEDALKHQKQRQLVAKKHYNENPHIKRFQPGQPLGDFASEPIYRTIINAAKNSCQLMIEKAAMYLSY